MRRADDRALCVRGELYVAHLADLQNLRARSCSATNQDRSKSDRLIWQAIGMDLFQVSAKAYVCDLCACQGGTNSVPHFCIAIA